MVGENNMDSKQKELLTQAAMDWYDKCAGKFDDEDWVWNGESLMRQEIWDSRGCVRAAWLACAEFLAAQKEQIITGEIK